MLSFILKKDVDKLRSNYLRPLESKGFIEVVVDSNRDASQYKFAEHIIFSNFQTLLIGSQKIKIHSKIVNYLESTGSFDHSLLAYHCELSGNHSKAAS